jgi:hypothetical protein
VIEPDLWFNQCETSSVPKGFLLTFKKKTLTKPVECLVLVPPIS